MHKITYEISEKILSIYNEIELELAKEILTVFSSEDCITSQCLKELFWDGNNFSHDKLLNILIGKKYKLIEFIKKYNNLTIPNEVKFKLNKIFNYSKYIDKHRKSILSDLKVIICPYCGMERIESYYVDDVLKSPTVFDHFFLKNLYPILSLSIYNLIPSCNHCNSNLKLQYDAFNNLLLYPYEEEFGEDAQFYLKNKNLNLIHDIKDILIDIKINENSDKRDKIMSNIKVFAIEERYSKEKEIVWEIINKYKDLENSWVLNEYLSLGLFKSVDDIKNRIKKEIIDGRLKKFRIDILNNLETAI